VNLVLVLLELGIALIALVALVAGVELASVHILSTGSVFFIFFKFELLK